MKAVEILCITILFIGCFLIAEFIVDHLLLESPFQRFIARVGFQFQFYGLVYLLFDTRDMARRLRRLEELISGKSMDDDRNTSAETES